LIRRFWAEKLEKKKRQILLTAYKTFQPSMTFNATMMLNAQMSLDYHLVDPLGDEEKDEQQSNVLDGC
jgi:hypothetical protein